MKKFIKSTGPSFFHIKIKTGTLPNLLRPKNFNEIKKKFMNLKNYFFIYFFLYLLEFSGSIARLICQP